MTTRNHWHRALAPARLMRAPLSHRTAGGPVGAEQAHGAFAVFVGGLVSTRVASNVA